jgi:hypothetical protein
MRGDNKVTAALRKIDRIGFSAISIGELFSGFKGGRREADNREALNMFLDSPRVVLHPVDEGTAEFYASILNDLRQNVISALKQTGQEGEARDGMDMALVVIDLEKMSLEFAGANNPLYIIRKEELNETKADRMPIAYHMESSAFTRHTVKLEKGDALYMFSDGYADQFGGPRGKKYMYKPFKRLLMDHWDKPMHEVQEVLERTLDEWMSPVEGPDYEQVDDILVIGLRV